MKPAWDQLGDAFKDSKTVVIGDVDCTVHQGLCSEHGVKGYPTVKYYVNGEWSDYEGGRDYDALKEFADENLGPSCTYPDNEDLCSEELDKPDAHYEMFDVNNVEKYEIPPVVPIIGDSEPFDFVFFGLPLVMVDLVKHAALAVSDRQIVNNVRC